MNKKLYDSLCEWESMKPNREKVTHDNNTKKHFTRETDPGESSFVGFPRDQKKVLSGQSTFAGHDLLTSQILQCWLPTQGILAGNSFIGRCHVTPKKPMTARVDKDKNRPQNIWKLLNEVKQWSVKYTTSFNNFFRTPEIRLVCRLLYKWSHSLWWVVSKHVLKHAYSTLQWL